MYSGGVHTKARDRCRWKATMLNKKRVNNMPKELQPKTERDGKTVNKGKGKDGKTTTLTVLQPVVGKKKKERYEREEGSEYFWN